MELIELIFKSKNIDPKLTVDVQTELTNGFRHTSQRYEIDPSETLTGLKVTVTVDKLWTTRKGLKSTFKCVAEEYTLISHKTVRNLTAENIMAVINQHI